ncbi:uncharacterized protein LOC144365374 isoform X2 [Ictidomys tridecemlineatus]
MGSEEERGTKVGEESRDGDGDRPQAHQRGSQKRTGRQRKDLGSKLLPYMMLPLFLLLFVGLPLVESNFTNVTKAVPATWTFNVQCHECVAENTFECSKLRTCLYDHRRCMTVAARLIPRSCQASRRALCTSLCSSCGEGEQTPHPSCLQRFRCLSVSRAGCKDLQTAPSSLDQVPSHCGDVLSWDSRSLRIWLCHCGGPLMGTLMGHVLSFLNYCCK